jgi:hypothetical protein
MMYHNLIYVDQCGILSSYGKGYVQNKYLVSCPSATNRTTEAQAVAWNQGIGWGTWGMRAGRVAFWTLAEKSRS